MRSSFLRLFIVSLIGIWLLSVTSPVQSKHTGGEAAPQPAEIGISETGLYIIQLEAPSLASYEGGIDNLQATSPRANRKNKINIHSPEVIAYTNYLNIQQVTFINQAEQVLEQTLNVAYRYTNVLNALAIEVNHNQAQRLAALPGVRAVYADSIHEPDTDVGPAWIEADEIWEGNTGSGLSTQGEGIIVGVIDTGINHAHPSFANPGGDGYEHVNPWGSGVYGGVCNPTDPNYLPGFCNDKLIAAYSFYPGVASPEDLSGHGSHTASTAVGNTHGMTLTWRTGEEITRTISGVAPHANLIAYKICHPHADCPDSAGVAAVNQAIADGVDVLNYSISGSDAPWNMPIELAFLDAYQAGIFVSASAGNSGPGASTAHHTGPWNASMGMTTHTRVFAKALDITEPYTPTLQNLPAVANRYNTNPTAALEYEIAYDPSNPSGCAPFSAGYFNGKLALLQRSIDCTYTEQVNSAATAGATGVTLFNDRKGPPTDIRVNGLGIPTFMLGLNEGLAAQAYLDQQAPVTVTAYINAPTQAMNSNDYADVVAPTSSRGPSEWEVLKPDYAAPGVNILGAYRANGGDPIQYARYTGTSMAAPHGAGAAALLMALHPAWSPVEIRSALASTPFPWWLMHAETADAVDPADPFDTGSGRIDLEQASRVGLVFDETYGNYLAANPSQGGDPKTLNQPSLVNYRCVGYCTWQREVKSVLPGIATYTLTTFTNSPTLTLTSEPSTFMIAPGATQLITFTAHVDELPLDQAAFGAILFSSDVEDTADQHIPVAVVPTASTVPDLIKIETTLKQGTQEVAGLQSTNEVITLTSRVAGLAAAELISGTLLQDPTNDDPFNEDGGTLAHLFTVPDNALRLVVEIAQAETEDIVLYIGTSITLSMDTAVCVSAVPTPQQNCEIMNPLPGDYWALAQNWQSSAPSSTDSVTMAVGVVISETVGNLNIGELNGIPALQPFDIDLHWDEPLLEDGQRWYGLVTLGSSGETPEDIGQMKVNLLYQQPVYSFDLHPAEAELSALPGETVSYTLWLTNTGNTPDTFTLDLSSEWPASTPSEIGPLAASASEAIQVSITIPSATIIGDSDTAQLTVTSQGNPSIIHTASLTTSALEPSTPTPTTTATATPPTPTITYTPTPTTTVTTGNIYLPILIR